MYQWGRILSILTGILNRILILGLSLFLLILLVNPELLPGQEGGLPLDLLIEYKSLLALGAIVLLVLNLNILQFILHTLWNSDVRRYISSKTTSGTARVSLDAIEKSLQTAAHDVPEVELCKLRVYRIGAKRYKVEVRFWIPDDCNALNINEKLRLILKKRFAELVAVEPDERVFFEINLAGFKGRRGPRPAGAGGPPRDAIDPSKRQFKGPVYPVDGEV
jgi:hypothetical protein